jgi:hypothetical protein
VALAVLLASETTAWAAASARLVYDRPPTLDGCVDEAHMRQAIAVRVGYDPIDPGAPNALTISIVRRGEQLVADVTLANRDGQRVGSRSLQAPTRQCDELTAAIALTVAIALDAIDKGTPAELSAPRTSSSSPMPATEPALDTPSTAPRGPHLSADAGPVVRTGPEAHARSSPRLELGVGMSGAPLDAQRVTLLREHSAREAPGVFAHGDQRGVGVVAKKVGPRVLEQPALGREVVYDRRRRTHRSGAWRRGLDPGRSARHRRHGALAREGRRLSLRRHRGRLRHGWHGRTVRRDPKSARRFGGGDATFAPRARGLRRGAAALAFRSQREQGQGGRTMSDPLDPRFARLLHHERARQRASREPVTDCGARLQA